MKPWAFAVLLLCASVDAFAQRGRGGPPQSPPSPRAGAPIDITGYWVALITEDWRYRQFTPPHGDYQSVPISPAGKKLADAWDPAKDEAAGGECKAFGAAGIMRMPTRLHITWQDDDTLKLETDAGTQTRTLHFRPSDEAGGGWQGISSASWDTPRPIINNSFGGLDFGFLPPAPPGGSLKVVTTKMRPGYLRKNGVPYSGATTMTEYFDRFDVPAGDALLVDIAEIVDPEYLTQPFWTSTHFKKQNDATGWNPTPCASR